MKKMLMAMMCLPMLTACGAATSGEMTKSEARALYASTPDTPRDHCDEQGWYGDGTCDVFCPTADPDCKGATGYEPCLNAVCGDACTLCDPLDSDCIETQVLKFCGADGACAATTPTCDAPPVYEPCGSGAVCGDTCTLCDPNDADCAETAVVKFCQADGGCAASQPTCDGSTEPYDPCGGATCGDTCSVCDPADPDCVETAEIKYCQADGSCGGTAPTCEDDAYEPCGGESACGDTCTICDPADPDCVETAVVKFCQADGSCSGVAPVCEDTYDPCEGAVCGDTCTLCDPADPDCVETAVVKFCQADGGCSAVTPSCGG